MTGQTSPGVAVCVGGDLGQEEGGCGGSGIGLLVRAVATTFRIHKIWAHVSHVAPRGALRKKTQPE